MEPKEWKEFLEEQNALDAEERDRQETISSAREGF
jgi:heme oxygenase